MAGALKNQTQISANIDISTKERMDQYVRAKGVTKGYLIEQALQHHLAALFEIPERFMIPVHAVLSSESAKEVVEMVTRPPESTMAMKKLFDDR